MRARASWARLIKQVYESDPLCCTGCGNEMRIIALIDDQSVIRQILEHLRKYDPTPPGGRETRYLPWKRTSI